MKFFQKFNLKIKKNVFFLFFGLVIFGFLFFPLPIGAAWYDFLVNAVLAVPTLMVGIVFGLLIMLTGGFAWLCGALLDWVTGPNFISFSYTNPGGTNPNPIIANGLDITQSLVNMFLVVALIYIAISIALRLTGEAGAKKALVRLIFIALIVNFAPVICGLIVDAANIAMNYFLVGIKEGVSGILSQAWEYGKTTASEAFKITGSLEKKFGLLMQGLMQIILNISIAFAFLLFTGIFYFRYFAIWILVILSPLAFVAWILPATKKLWNMWWNSFLQWSIIGVAGAFFLYLGMSTFGALRGALMSKVKLPGLEPTTATFLDNIIPFLAVAIFLYLGFIITLATSAFGAKTAINLTKTGGKALGGFVGKAGGALARKTLGTKGKEWMEKQASARFMPEKIAQMKGLKGVAAKIGYGAIAGPAVWAVRRGMGEAGLKWTESERADLRKAEKDYEGTIPERKMAAIRDLRLSPTRRVAALNRAIEEEQIKDLKKLGLTKDEIIKIGRGAIKTHPEELKKIRDAFPYLAKEIGKGFTEDIKEKAGLDFTQKDKDLGYGDLMDKIMAKLTPEKITKMDRSILYGAEATEETKDIMHKFWSREQLMSAGRTFGREFTKEFMDDYRAKISTQPDWYDLNNTKLSPKHLKASPAFQGLFGRIEWPSSGPIPPSPKPPAAPPPPPPKTPRGRPGIGVEEEGEEEVKKPPRGRGGVGMPE